MGVFSFLKTILNLSQYIAIVVVLRPFRVSWHTCNLCNLRYETTVFNVFLDVLFVHF